MGYTAPLRATVERLASREQAWDYRTVAALAHVAPSRASAYLRRLVAEGVLVTRPPGFGAGEAFARWAQEQPRTRPGGCSCSYRFRADADQESLRRARLELARLVREGRERLRMSRRALSVQSDVAYGTIWYLEHAYFDTCDTTRARLARVLGVEL